MRLRRLMDRADTLLARIEARKHSIALYGVPDDFIAFNHWLGLPVKDGREHPIYPYEVDYYSRVREHRLVVVNKATGIGITETTLRTMLHASLGWGLKNRRFCIVTGTNISLAKELLNRLEAMISRRQGWLVKARRSNALLLCNGSIFHVYPAANIDAIRGLTDVAFILVDEAAFFRLRDQDRVREAIERYIAKTNPYIVWVSTPRGRVGAFYEIYKDAVDGKNGYHAITLPYTVALNTLLDEHYIEVQKRVKGRLFRQEYCCEFLEDEASVFSMDDIKDLLI
ncbi:MAG: terminase family protein [Candidatus Nitrosocaldus sp.]